MSDPNPQRWHNPMLKPLPKYMHGEFRTLERRAESIQKKIDELKKLEEMDVDINAWYNEDPVNKYFKAWYDKEIEAGNFIQKEDSDYIYSVAWQSVWPEEASRTIYQYMHDALGISFKWWTLGFWDKYDNKDIMKLQKTDAQIVMGALPNINGNFYACTGDYGSKFQDTNTGKITKMIELGNYTGSPNLREDPTIECIYTQVGIAFQYCDIKVKRNGIEETTTIADLILEMREKDNWEEIRENTCSRCRNNDRYVGRSILLPTGQTALSFIRQLLYRFDDEIDKVKEVMTTIDLETIKKLLFGGGYADACSLCSLNPNDLDEAKNLVAFVKEEFAKEMTELNEMTPQPEGTW